MEYETRRRWTLARFRGLIRARCSAASQETSSHGTAAAPDRAVTRLQNVGGLISVQLALLVSAFTPALDDSSGL
jgi:hypothetical protein